MVVPLAAAGHHERMTEQPPENAGDGPAGDGPASDTGTGTASVPPPSSWHFPPEPAHAQPPLGAGGQVPPPEAGPQQPQPEPAPAQDPTEPQASWPPAGTQQPPASSQYDAPQQYGPAPPYGGLPQYGTPPEYGGPQQQGTLPQYGAPQQYGPPPPYGGLPQYEAPPQYYGAPPQHGAPQYGMPPQYGAPAPYGAPYPPYAAGPPGAEPDLAEWWRRLLGRLIDILVIGAVTTPIAIAMLSHQFSLYRQTIDRYPDINMPGAQAAINRADGRLLGAWLGFVAVAVVISFLYDSIQHGLWGQTLGKRAVGTRVVSARDRSKIGGGTAAGRAATYTLIPVVPLIGTVYWLLDALWLLWDRRRQCLHDKAAHTIVIKIRTPGVGPQRPGSPW
jgi:uncharacterized RDD family membrane protein YckC